MANNPLNEDWDDDDNKNYRGKTDRMYVSLTEEYEVKYFIDAYLKRRDITDNAANRKVIENEMRQYPGRSPILRSALNEWLDQRLTVTRSGN